MRRCRADTRDKAPCHGHAISVVPPRSKAKAKAGTVAQPDGTVSCLRCSNRPSEMHQVTSSSYVAAAGWRPLRLPRPLSFDVQKVIRHCCKSSPQGLARCIFIMALLGCFMTLWTFCLDASPMGLGLAQLSARHPPWGGRIAVR